MKELTIISGKGGTGKTSLTVSLAALMRNGVLADCDVDAADLFLVTGPRVISEEGFSGGFHAVIDPERCTGCGVCLEHCRYGAVTPDFTISSIGCEGCKVCVEFCPEKAIDWVPNESGRLYVSETRFGPMVHAKLGIAEENSGKLVSQVRERARQTAQGGGRDLVLVDGPPGIGCPVIAAVTGASAVLIVSEPTLSGAHDLERVAKLCEHFDIPAMSCVNKADINPEMAEKIRLMAEDRGMSHVGEVPYDPDVTRSMIEEKALVECSDGPAARAIRDLWGRVLERMESIKAS